MKENPSKQTVSYVLAGILVGLKLGLPMIALTISGVPTSTKSDKTPAAHRSASRVENVELGSQIDEDKQQEEIVQAAR